MSFLRQLKKEVHLLEKKCKEVQRGLNGLPEGKVWCRKKNNTYQYYSGGNYIRKDHIDWIQKVVQREYYCKVLPYVKKRLELLKELEVDYEADMLLNSYKCFVPGKKQLILSAFEDKEQYIKEWQAEEYEVWEVEGEIVTNRGEVVRSKSEKIIADELYRLGIPYKYEYPLAMVDGRKVKVFRPDFIALNTDSLEEIVLEHLGMMDDEDYVSRTMRKLDIYERNGYLIGKNLIIFREDASNPLNVKVMRDYLETFLL